MPAATSSPLSSAATMVSIQFVGMKPPVLADRYRDADARSMEQLAGDAGAEAIFTTEKDLVKLQHLVREWTVPVIALRADLDFSEDDMRTVMEQVQRVIPNSERSGHET